MAPNSIQIENKADILTATIDCVENNNSLNAQGITELHAALDQAEADPNCHALVLQGKAGVFCTGMDFKQLTHEVTNGEPISVSGKEYMALLKRVSLSPKYIIAKVDGRVLAGGVGIVAASDIVLASNQSQFTLSEAVWGLLPANVMPFLIRRIGFQPAYLMTLTTRDISAQKAYELHLVDESADDLEDALRRLMLNLRRVKSHTVAEAKQFFRQMWLINEEMENTAIQQLAKLIALPEVTSNISNFVLHQKFPWEKQEG